jgi:hypothetical protein
MDYDFKLELILRDFPIIRDKVYMKDGASGQRTSSYCTC